MSGWFLIVGIPVAFLVALAMLVYLPPREELDDRSEGEQRFYGGSWR